MRWQNQSVKLFGKVILLKDKLAAVLRKIRNFIITVVVLTLLVIAAFVAAIKFDVLSTEDVAMLNEELGLYRLPFVGNGRYFEVPEGVEWPPIEPIPEPEPPPPPEPKPEEKSADDKSKDDKSKDGKSKDDKAKDGKSKDGKTKDGKKDDKPKEVKIDKKAIDEQRKEREAAEKKRVTRLARIYENMKPEEAAKALVNVDWDTTVLIFQRMSEDAVAAILAKMDPEQAAQLTEMLFAGTQRRVTTPQDTMRNQPVTPTEEVPSAE